MPRRSDAAQSRARKRRANNRKRAARRLRPVTPRAERARTWSLRLLVLLIAFACGPLVLWTDAGLRALPAVGIGLILFMLLARSPGWGSALTLIYLSLLGGLRRWLIPALGWTSTDPLLLVGPALVFGWFVNLLLTRRIHHDTRLARLLLWLLAVMFLEVGNPLQGGVGVGLGGILFVIVPALWYYYGREIGRDRLMLRMLGVAVGVAVAGALYGLCQTYIGLLPSELEWVRLHKTSYNALYIAENVIRAFSFFTSAQEYVQFLSIGTVICWCAFLRGLRAALIPLPLLALTIFLSSTRGAVVITLLTCVIVWAIQGRSLAAWAPRLALAGVLASSGLFWSLSKVQENSYGDQTQALVDHQVSGLLKPTEQKSSTANSHLTMVTQGIAEGFRVPVGRGLGATTIAASKFEEKAEGGSAEVDLSDAFIGLGFAGGLLYAAILINVLNNAVWLWRNTRTPLSLMTLGILIVHIGQWLHGGSYAASMLVWMLIGAMDRNQAVARLAKSNASRRPDSRRDEPTADDEKNNEKKNEEDNKEKNKEDNKDSNSSNNGAGPGE